MRELEKSCDVSFLSRKIDELSWNHCKGGFFKLKSKVTSIVDTLLQPTLFDWDMKTLINDFSKFDKHFRANLINSVIGVKQASLIGTVGSNGISNLALFSSTVHLGSNPPLVAIFSRPEGDAPKQTLNNIIDIKDYSINHVNKSIINRAHSCSFKFTWFNSYY